MVRRRKTTSKRSDREPVSQDLSEDEQLEKQGDQDVSETSISDGKDNAPVNPATEVQDDSETTVNRENSEADDQQNGTPESNDNQQENEGESAQLTPDPKKRSSVSGSKSPTKDRSLRSVRRNLIANDDSDQEASPAKSVRKRKLNSYAELSDSDYLDGEEKTSDIDDKDDFENKKPLKTRRVRAKRSKRGLNLLRKGRPAKNKVSESSSSHNSEDSDISAKNESFREEITLVESTDDERPNQTKTKKAASKVNGTLGTHRKTGRAAAGKSSPTKKKSHVVASQTILTMSDLQSSIDRVSHLESLTLKLQAENLYLLTRNAKISRVNDYPEMGSCSVVLKKL